MRSIVALDFRPGVTPMFPCAFRYVFARTFQHRLDRRETGGKLPLNASELPPVIARQCSHCHGNPHLPAASFDLYMLLIQRGQGEKRIATTVTSVTVSQ